MRLEKRPCPCGCRKFVLYPTFYSQDASCYESEADEIIAMQADAARFRFIIANPMATRALSFQKAADRVAFVDKQMAKAAEKAAKEGE